MGGATYDTSPTAWKQQIREYCGREARVTNRANGKSMLLYIGDSFAHPRSDGAIDIVIGAFKELYGSDPNGNHNLVMNSVEWELTGNFDPAYTADGANFQSDGSENTVNTAEAGNTNPQNFDAPTTLTTTTRGKVPSSTPASTPEGLDCDWGCYGWDCSPSQPCQDQYTCRGGSCKP